MAFGFVAFHYLAREHVEEFVRSCHQVIDAGRTQPGVLRAEVWVTPDRQVHFLLSQNPDRASRLREEIGVFK